MSSRRADDLCKSYMINTKIFYANTVYGHTEAVMDLITDLGVRVIRERVTTGTSTGTKKQLYAMPRLAKQGTKWHATVGVLEDWRNATAVNREAMKFVAARYAPLMGGNVGALMHSFGGCNEIEGPGLSGGVDPDWAVHARVMQRALWQEAKGNRATARIPIAGPSTRTDFTLAKAARLGDLSPWSDIGNGHLYNKGTSPTRGIDDHLRILRPCFPGIQKYIISETGYNNSRQTNANVTVPESASAIYGIRGICDYFKRGAMYGRFELLDDPDVVNTSTQTSINQTANIQSHFGLVAMTKGTVRDSTPGTWRKKPEFHATKRLLKLLEDRGPSFTPRPLRMAVTGGGGDLQQLLLQKRNGKHYLVLWRDVPVSRAYPDGRPIDVPAVRVTVHLETARPTRLWGPNRSETPLRRDAASRSIVVNLRGDLKVLEIG